MQRSVRQAEVQVSRRTGVARRPQLHRPQLRRRRSQHLRRLRVHGPSGRARQRGEDRVTEQVVGEADHLTIGVIGQERAIDQ